MATGNDKAGNKSDVMEDLRRSFEYAVEGETKTFYLEMPTSEQIRKAEWHYSKMYNKALLEGVATTSEMMDILTKRGIYGTDYEKKLQDLQVQIATKIAEMNNQEDEATKAQLAREVRDLRDELYRWNQRVTGPLSNTCEQMADDAKTEYLTSAIVKDEAGNQVWDSYDSFVSEEDQGLALKARFEVLLWLQGLEPDFLDQTPENKVLRELSLQKAEAEAEQASEEPPKLNAPKEDNTGSTNKASSKGPSKSKTKKTVKSQGQTKNSGKSRGRPRKGTTKQQS